MEDPSAAQRMHLFGSSLWHLVPRPLSAFGSTVTPLDSASAEALSRDPPPDGGAAAVLDGSQAGRMIHPDEFTLFGEMLERRDDSTSWKLLSDKAGVQIKRRADESLSGAVTMMIEASLPNIPLEVVADVLSNFSGRNTWDKQQTSFSCHDDWGCPQTHANGIFRFVLHMPPFADRDFVNFIAIAKRSDGSAYMAVARDAEHHRYMPPDKSVIRAQLLGNVCYVYRNEHDRTSTSFVMITKQDVKMAYIPTWLINYFVPGELTSWKKKLQRVCEEKLSMGDLPLAVLFLPRFPSATTSAVATSSSTRDVQDAEDSEPQRKVPFAGQEIDGLREEKAPPMEPCPAGQELVKRRPETQQQEPVEIDLRASRVPGASWSCWCACSSMGAGDVDGPGEAALVGA